MARKIVFHIFFWSGFMFYINNGYSQYKFRRFTTSEGLSHDITYDMLQDSLGRLWVGTDDGLDCYDGKKFKQITSYDGLYSNYVIGLCFVPGFKMGIATWGGGTQIINLDDLTVERCTSPNLTKLKNVFYHENLLISASDYQLQKNTIDKNSCKSQQFMLKKRLNGDSYLEEIDLSKNLGSIDEAYKFSGIKLGKDFYIFNDPKKTVLKTKPLTGIYKLLTSSNKEIELKPSFEMVKNRYVSLLTSYEDNLYIGVHDTLLVVKNNKIIEEKALKLDGNDITKVVFISKKRYCILTMDANGNKYGYLNDNGKILDLKKYCNIRNSLSDILIDHDGNIWVSSYGDGIFQIMLKKELITYMGADKFLDPNIFGMAASISGSMILLSRDYVYEYSNGNVIEQAINNTCREVKSTIDGTYLFCFDLPFANKNEKYIFKPYENSLLEGVGEVKNKNNFITLQDDSTRIFFEIGIQIKSLTNINGDLFWIADQKAIYKISAKEKKILEVLPFESEMCSNKITKLLYDKEKLLVGTDRCLLQYFKGNWSRIPLEKKDEIIAINDLLVAANGDLWVASQQGLYRIDKSGNIKLDKSSGLLNDYVKAVCLDRDGQLWAATNNGVNIVDIKNLKTTAYPQFHIKQQECFFTIFAISLEKPSSVITQYQLDGESVWKDVINNEVEFCNLKYGKHNVKFQTRMADNNWLSSQDYFFEIKAPWFKTASGLALIFLLGTSLIGFLSLYFIKKMQQRNKYLGNLIHEKDTLEVELNNARNTIAKDFHDDLGNKMARISIMSELLIQDSELKNSKLKSNLQQIKLDADILYKNTRDFIWSLSPESNQMYEIDTYLCDFAENFFENLEVRFDVKRNYDQTLKIPYQWSRQIILIFKEIMTNAAKHAYCTDVVFEIKSNENELTISFKDNGKGISKSDLESNRGLANIKTRSGKIGGELAFTNISTGGMKFVLILPLIEKPIQKV